MARIGQSSVVADLSDRNFEFYVRRGTFGDINGGNDIEIPSDVRISTGDPNGAIYLTDPVTLAAPDLVGISLSTTVEFKAGTSAEEEKSLALSAAEDYINNLRVGETLVLNQIADRLLNADPKILEVRDKEWSLNSNLIVNTTWFLDPRNIAFPRP